MTVFYLHLTPSQCEEAARSIGWVRPLKVEDFPEGSPFSKSMRMTCFFLEAAEKRVAELERELSDTKDKLANEEYENSNLRNAYSMLRADFGKLVENRDEWRVKYEATQQPEKLTGLTHAEVERLMKETPGRVARLGPIRRRWFNNQWEEWKGFENTWTIDEDPSWQSGSNDWSIEPLAEPGDGLVTLAAMEPGEKWIDDSNRVLIRMARQQQNITWASEDDVVPVLYPNGVIVLHDAGKRVRRVEGPR